jgi:high affinity sulfate transporter 1
LTAPSIARDVLAGVAVAMLLIPQGVAYSSLAGVSVSIGLVSCVVPPIMYALTGHSRQSSVGPEALASILTGTFLATLPPEAGDQAARLLTLAVGTVMFVLGVLRMGFIDATMSPPVMHGFQNAVALEIIFSQLSGLFGVVPHEGGDEEHAEGWEAAWLVLKHARESNVCSVILGVATIATLLAFKQLKSRMRWPLLPDTVLVLGGVTAVATLGKFADKYGLPLLGDTKIPSGLPTPGFDAYIPGDHGEQHLWTVIYGRAMANAIIIVLVGFVEAVAVSKRMSQKYQYTCSANRELVAFGLTNLVSACFGSMPTFASLARSELADSAGARTQVFGLVSAALSLVAAYWLTLVLVFLPKIVVSALVIVAATGLFEAHHAIFLVTTRAWSDFALMGFTFTVTIGLGVETGVLLALLASLLQLVRRAASPHVAVMGRVRGADEYADISENSEALPLDGVLVVRIDEVHMHSANTPALMMLLDRLERLGSFHLFSDDNIYSRLRDDPPVDPSSQTALAEVPVSGLPTPRTADGARGDTGPRRRPPPPRGVVFDMRRVREIDSSALALLLDLSKNFETRGIALAFVQPNDEVKRSLVVAGVIGALGGTTVYPNIHSAVIGMHGEVPGVRTHLRDHLNTTEEVERGRSSAWVVGGAAQQPPQSTERSPLIDH